MQGAIPDLSNARVHPYGYSAAHWKHVAIVVWRARVERASAQGAVDFTHELLRVHALLSTIHVVEDTAELPTAEARDVFAAAHRAQRSRIACIGVLLPQHGLRSTLFMAFARTIRPLLRGDIDLVIESSATALAARFVVEHARRTQVQLAKTDLLAAIEATRRLGGH